MREYNLFVIKNNIIKMYENNDDKLYEILFKLYNMKCNNYGITLFSQLCNRINLDSIRYYMNSKYNLNNDKIFYIDNSYIILKPSRIIIKSKYNFPSIIKMFNCYSRNIFVCDFINNDYFWLNIFVRNKVLQYI